MPRFPKESSLSSFGEQMSSRWPWAGSGHGPLPILLVLLTVVTGIVDAVSYIALGHVFVANMTGNVVFLGFALAGASGLSVPASLTALGAFLLGALTGGRIAVVFADHRGRHLRTATARAIVPVLLAVILAAILDQPVSQSARYLLIVPLAFAMGIQNATARALAVPDLTTTVLTLTLTGIAADSRFAHGPGAHAARRLISVSAMFAGALIGGLLAINVDLLLPLALAAVLMASSAVLAHRLSIGGHDWVKPPGHG
ncbi:MAG TPA: YoaK family protein [Solirubrobacteraceae bacterium]